MARKEARNQGNLEIDQEIKTARKQGRKKARKQESNP
jgi:hypothetical protein